MAVQLTVIVKGADGKAIEGASVSVTPGEVMGKTNNKGEVTLKIDGADRYDVTVTDKDTTQTVPYYSLKGKDTARLEVNLAYLTEQENQQQTVVTPSESPALIPGYVLPVAGGVIIGAFLLLLVVLLGRKRGAKKDSETEEAPVKAKAKTNKKSPKRDSKDT